MKKPLHILAFLLLSLFPLTSCDEDRERSIPRELSILTAINNVWNQSIRYKADIEDDWQHPRKTLRLGTGDCEDYALAKMWQLKPVLPHDKLFLIHLFTEKGEAHMVLGYGSIDNPWILDNRYANVFRLKDSGYSDPNYYLDANGIVFTSDRIQSPKSHVTKFENLASAN